MAAMPKFLFVFLSVLSGRLGFAQVNNSGMGHYKCPHVPVAVPTILSCGAHSLSYCQYQGIACTTANGAWESEDVLTSIQCDSNGSACPPPEECAGKELSPAVSNFILNAQKRAQPTDHSATAKSSKGHQ